MSVYLDIPAWTDETTCHVCLGPLTRMPTRPWVLICPQCNGGAPKHLLPEEAELEMAWAILDELCAGGGVT